METNFISELEIKKNYKFIKKDISNFKRMHEINYKTLQLGMTHDSL